MTANVKNQCELRKLTSVIKYKIRTLSKRTVALKIIRKYNEREDPIYNSSKNKKAKCEVANQTRRKMFIYS